MNLKRFLKKENPFPSPLTLFPLAAHPTGPTLYLSLSAAHKPARADGISRVRAAGRPSSSSSPGPTAASLLSFFDQPPTGGARRSGSSPTSGRGSAAPPSRPPAVTGHLPRAPSFKPCLKAAVKLPLHAPPSIGRYPSLTSPLNSNQGRDH
jgi:hypothetical protein